MRLKTGHYLVASTAILGVLVAPVAVFGASDGGPTAQTAGKKKRDPIQIQVRNRSRGETGLVTVSDGFSMRLSNKQVGDGGGAIYGCRSATGREPCVEADNLNTGFAFVFRTRKGNTAGRIEAPGGANAKPFTTNATGVATGLNADEVDGRGAGDIVNDARSGANCPTGTSSSNVNVCIETTPRAATNFSNAARTCQASKRRLPLPSELESFRLESGVTLDAGGEFTENVTHDGANAFIVTYTQTGAPGRAAYDAQRAYRCVVA